MSISKYLERYTEITIQLVNKINNNDQDFENLIDERAKIVGKILNSNINKNEFNEKVKSLNIVELDNKLQDLIREEKNKTKKQIDLLRKTRQAAKQYNKINEKLKIFSAKG